MKDVKAGEVYAVVSWYSTQDFRGDPERWTAVEWENFGKRATPVRALEVGVDVPTYRRKGVQVQALERDTLEPAVKHGTESDPNIYAIRAINLLGPWQAMHDLYHDYVEDQEERRATEAERRDRERLARQEEAAARWRTEEFDRARRHIEQVSEVLGNELPTGTRRDAAIRTLVELRNPNGNPYENGTFTVS